MNQYQSLAPWRGCKNVMFGYCNDYADPDLLYKGYVFNFRENADMYLDELIANGYFHGDSKSGHDKM